MVVGVMDLVPYRLLDPQTLGQAGPGRPPIFHFYCGRVLVILRLHAGPGNSVSTASGAGRRGENGLAAP
jgi:hypothetical protein